MYNFSEIIPLDFSAFKLYIHNYNTYIITNHMDTNYLANEIELTEHHSFTKEKDLIPFPSTNKYKS